MRKVVVSAVALAVLLCMSASPLLALSPVTYMPVSMDHTKYGVSQYQTGLATGYATRQKIVNPTPVEMVVLIMSYERPADIGMSDGVFTDCAVVSIKPHGVATTEVTIPGLIEVIAAPLDPVMVNGQMTRMADGLGVIADMGFYGGGDLIMRNPMDFILPNTADLGAAGACLKAGLKNVGAPANTFAEFLP